MDQKLNFILLNQKINIKRVNINIVVLKVKNYKKCIGNLHYKLYKIRKYNFIAITGTSGKTSAINFYQQIYYLSRCKSVTIGSVGIFHCNSFYKIKNNFCLTSPSVIKVCIFLKKLRNKTIVGLEASSQGIQQHRLGKINFSAIGFTNFNENHLNYHKSSKLYFNAKLKIFTKMLKKGGYAVLNKDTKKFVIIRDICKKKGIKVMQYGKKAKDLKNKHSKNKYFCIDTLGKKYVFNFRIVDIFQIQNMLCAIGLAITKEMSINAINNARHIIPIKGRLELINCYHGGKIYIDYSHTNIALKGILHSIREKFYKNKLYIILGYGGERDVYKNSVIGKILTRLNTCITITNDNPRRENCDIIRRNILKDMYHGVEIKRRSKAIKYMVSNLNKSAILLIIGKGHEKYQIINTRKIYLNELLYIKIRYDANH